MYKTPKFHKTTIDRNEAVEGETIEKKIYKMLNNGEDTDDPSVEIIYTERKDGVIPTYNIRHDKWDTAQEAMNKVAKSYEAKRYDKIKERETTPEPQETAEKIED